MNPTFQAPPPPIKHAPLVGVPEGKDLNVAVSSFPSIGFAAIQLVKTTYATIPVVPASFEEDTSKLRNGITTVGVEFDIAAKLTNAKAIPADRDWETGMVA